jgi:cytochrome P450
MASVVDLNSRTASARPARQADELPISRIDFGEFSSDLLGNFRRLHELHGPIAAIEDGGQKVVFLFSPEYNQIVLSDTERFHARFFTIRGPKRSAQRRVTCGLLSMNGDQHRRNRRIVKEPFGLRAISTYGDTIVRLTDEMLDSWRVGEVLDVAEEMRQYMLRVTSTLLFGMDDPEAACRLGDMIANWVTRNHEVGVGALVPNEKFSEGYEELLGYAEVLEAEVLAMIRRRRESDVQGNDVLSVLVRSNDAEGGLSDEELVGQAAVLFSAAHLTTAHSLTWTLFLLSQHPGVMKQLWQELSSANGQASNGDDPQSRVPPGCRNPKSLGSLPKGEELSLLDRVIKESMRVLPASAYSQRMTTEAVQLGPLHLPRGTGIVFTPIIIHHLADLYPQPEQFLPDRWINLRPSPYAYHPFGAGPRLCIGAPLATAIIRVALERILKRYRPSVVPGSDIGVHIESTMLFPTNPVPMEIHPADGNYCSNPVVGNIRDLVELDDPHEYAAVPSFESSNGHGSAAAPRKPR